MNNCNGLEGIMKKERSWQCMAWMTILFIIAVAASCSTFPPIPDHVDHGAVKYAVEEVLNALQ